MEGRGVHSMIYCIDCFEPVTGGGGWRGRVGGGGEGVQGRGRHSLFLGAGKALYGRFLQTDNLTWSPDCQSYVASNRFCCFENMFGVPPGICAV